MPELFPPLLTVSELTKQIRSNLEEKFSSVWVEGEISNLRCPSSGHQYLTLKDQNSQIRAVMFRNQAQRLKFAMQDGMDVLIFGRLTVYEPRGDYQLLLERVEPKGIGALQLAFKQLKAKLEAERLFDESRKQVLPPFPERIGVITSPIGAAIHDLLTVMRRRWPLAHILLAPVAVQGETAAGQIAAAVQMFNRTSHPSEKVDVLIVGRGGGSLEDLWAFNEERVVRAFAASQIPIVSAVGHETDFSLADLAADCRAPTPSAAAELVVPDFSIVQEQLTYHHARLERSVKGMVAALTVRVQRSCQRLPEPRLIIANFVQRVDDLERQLYQKMKEGFRNIQLLLLHQQSAIWEANPLLTIHREQDKVAELKKSLVQGMKRLVLLRGHQAKLSISQMHQLSPLAVLARGYSIVRDLRNGKVVKNSIDMIVGAKVQANLAEGQLVCRVEQILPRK